MTNEIIFSGKHKDFSLEEQYILDGASEEDILYVLSYLSEKIDSQSYLFAGIDNKKIESHVNSIAKGSGLSSLIQILESIKSTELKNTLLDASNNDKKFLPIAESYFIHLLLKKLEIPFKFSPSQFKSSVKPKKETQEGRIVFVANFKGWMSIKKLKLENVKDYDVSAILASVNFTIINKMFELAGVEDEAQVNNLTKGRRKSPTNLAEALKGIDEKDENKKAYLVCKVCEKLNYRPYASPHMLGKAYPDIKPPKSKRKKS